MLSDVLIRVKESVYLIYSIQLETRYTLNKGNPVYKAPILHKRQLCCCLRRIGEPRLQKIHLSLNIVLNGIENTEKGSRTWNVWNLVNPKMRLEEALLPYAVYSHLFSLSHWFSTKGRLPLIKGIWRERLYSYIGGIIRNTGGVPLAIVRLSPDVSRLATVWCAFTASSRKDK